jgi:hypothetical protein
VLTALAHIGPANPAEFQDLISTTARLQPIADATGGSVRRVAPDGGATPRIVPVSSRGAASGRDWIGLRRSDASVLKSVDQLPLIGGLLGLVLLIGAFSALWYREAR